MFFKNNILSVKEKKKKQREYGGMEKECTDHDMVGVKRGEVKMKTFCNGKCLCEI